MSDTLREALENIAEMSMAGWIGSVNEAVVIARDAIAAQPEADPLCRCGSPKSRHRSEKVAHHSECTMEQFIERKDGDANCTPNQLSSGFSNAAPGEGQPTLGAATLTGSGPLKERDYLGEAMAARDAEIAGLRDKLHVWEESDKARAAFTEIIADQDAEIAGLRREVDELHAEHNKRLEHAKRIAGRDIHSVYEALDQISGLRQRLEAAEAEIAGLRIQVEDSEAEAARLNRALGRFLQH